MCNWFLPYTSMSESVLREVKMAKQKSKICERNVVKSH